MLAVVYTLHVQSLHSKKGGVELERFGEVQ